MNGGGLTYIAQQFLYQGPVLLAALVGLVLSFVFLGRYRAPALLTLLAMVILLVATAAVTGAQVFLIYSRLNQAVPYGSYGQLQTVIAMLGSLARALSIGLMLVAAFIGRKSLSAAAV